MLKLDLTHIFYGYKKYSREKLILYYANDKIKKHMV